MTATQDYEQALAAWQNASQDLLVAIPRWAGEKARSFFPEAQVLRCIGDVEGSDFSFRLRLVAVLDAAGNILSDDDEHQTDEWDEMYEALLDLDYMPLIDPDYLSHVEIDCDSGQVTLVSSEWK